MASSENLRFKPISSLASSSSSTVVSVQSPNWPERVSVADLFESNRQRIEKKLTEVADLSATKWLPLSSSSSAKVPKSVDFFTHTQNGKNNLSYIVRSAVSVRDTSVFSIMDFLQTTTSEAFQTNMKRLHRSSFLDGQVLYANENPHNPNETIALKWRVHSTTKTLRSAKPKEFLYTEYCNCFQVNEPNGEVTTTGLCFFESYDGIGSKYGIRAKKKDSYKLAVFEPSGYVVQSSSFNPHVVSINYIMSCKKAFSKTSVVNTTLRNLANTFAFDSKNLSDIVLSKYAGPGTLMKESLWVADTDRTNCSCCMVSFSKLFKRKHHCRVCGEIFCASCTEEKSILMPDSNERKQVKVCVDCIAVVAKSARDMDGSNRNFNTCIESGKSFLSSSTVLSTSSSSSSTSSSSASTSDFDDTIADQDVVKRRGTSTIRQKLLSSNHLADIVLRDFVNPDVDLEDFEEICMTAKQQISCSMTSIRTDFFRITVYSSEDPLYNSNAKSKQMPCFSNLSKDKRPCIILDIANDKRLTPEEKNSTDAQFFIGVPIFDDLGNCLGDICVADETKAKLSVECKQLELLEVLASTAANYFQKKKKLFKKKGGTKRVKKSSSIKKKNSAENSSIESYSLREHAF